jgi:acetyl-CoA acetyltransferase
MMTWAEKAAREEKITREEADAWSLRSHQKTISGSDPTLTYPAVPDSVNKALTKIDITIDQVDLIEIQEAFAVQALADARMMSIKKEAYDTIINVNGSGISLGNPSLQPVP